MSIEELYSGIPDGEISQPTIDIIAIHGLNPWNASEHAMNTWQDPESGHLWLRDALPKEVKYARVLLYSYASSPAIHTAKERFIFRANKLLECLRIYRRQDPKRPLIFVSHSLGGILVKQALVNAQANPFHKDIKEATFGLVFFGTPHEGPTMNSKVRFGKACVAIAKLVPGNPSNDMMQALEKGTLFSDHLHEHFRQQLEQYQFVSFYEEIGNLVPRDSATLGLQGDRENEVGLTASHDNMCRFNPGIQQDRNNYVFVEANISDLCAKASAQEIIKTQDICIENKSPDIRDTDRKDSFKPDVRRKLETLIAIGSKPDISKQLVPDHCPSSLDWFLNETDYRRWKESNESCVFRIKGSPAQGKSVLAKFVVQDLGVSSTSSKAEVLYFACFGRGAPGFDTIEAIAKSFCVQLFQLLVDAIPQDGSSRAVKLPVDVLAKLQVYLDRPEVFRESTWRKDLQLFKDLIGGVPASEIYVVLDGLDECKKSGNDRRDFLMELATMHSTTGISRKRVKFFIASRPAEDDIEMALQQPTFEWS